MSYDAVIIGAGHNGLVSAAYLAQAGLQVIVLERRDIEGGAAVTENVWPGWNVSTASYVCSLLHPEVIERLRLTSFGYEAYAKDPASFTPLEDGRSLLLSRDPCENAREIGAFDSGDIEGHRAFQAHIARLGGVVYDSMLLDDRDLPAFAAAGRAEFAKPVGELAQRYVRTQVLQAALVTDGLIGTNAGPWSAGTTFVLAYHCAGRALGPQGAWGYVRGGMGSISRAIAAAAKAARAEIRTNAAVVRILVEDGRAAGVVLDDDTEIRGRSILCNADPKTTFLKLTPAGTLPDGFIARVREWRSQGVSLKLNLALGELPNFSARPSTSKLAAPHLRASIHVAPSLEYLHSAYEDARAGGVSRQPLLECFLQSPTDDTIAPAGKHLLSVFAQYYPYDRSQGGWSDQTRQQAADDIVACIARLAPNVPNAIEARQILAPPDLEARFGLSGGHIFHGELLPGQIFEQRFATRTPIQGLYLCGSGAHPGGCVSGAPGARAAKAVLADMLSASGRTNGR